MTLLAFSHILQIENYVPGKAKNSGKASGQKTKTIKLSSNENALGASPKAIQAYVSHSQNLFRYAEGSCQDLREKIAEKNKISAAQIVCGAGSDEIIALLTMAFAGIGDEIIYSEHGFLMYPICAQKVGAKPIKAKEQNLKTSVEEILKNITNKTKIIFVANPNNPTGSYLNQLEIKRLIDGTPKNILIVLDHAYEEFVDALDYPNAIELVNQNPNVVVTRTFSKIYGLASLRIGWCYCSNYIAEILNKIRGPFNVGGPAQEAALAALEDEEFLSASKNHNKKWLEIFADEISFMPSIKAHPSIANFVLIDFGSAEKCRLANQKLLQNEIILREMTSYNLPNCLRASIGTADENSQTLEILKTLS